MTEDTRQIEVGTRIRFLKTLEEGPTGDHPALIYAVKGDLGTITEVGGCKEGFWAKWDKWPHAFGCSRDEFEIAE